MEIVHTEILEIIFGTSNSTRKYKNLTAQNVISIVIGFDGINRSLQREGKAKVLTKKLSHKYAKALLEKELDSKKICFSERPEIFPCNSFMASFY